MRNPESFPNPEYSLPLVRVFPLVPIEVSDFRQRLADGQSIDKLSFIHVVLMQENGSYGPISGQRDSDETVGAAAMRLVFEQTTLTRESFHGFQEMVQKSTEDVVCIPIRSATFSLHRVRNGSGTHQTRKIVLQEARTLHGLMEDADVIDRISQEAAMYEDRYRDVMKMVVNRERRLGKKTKISSLMECDTEELVTAFISAQKYLCMQDEFTRDSRGGAKPAVSADILSASLFLSQVSPDHLVEALVAPQTVEERRIRNALKYALRGTVALFYNQLDRDIRPFTDGKTSLAYLRTLDALDAIWTDFVALPVVTQVEVMKKLNAKFIEELARRIGKPRATVEHALEMPDSLPKYLADELTSTVDRFQMGHPSNELINLYPFIRTLYILGYSPYVNSRDILSGDKSQRLRGDAMIGWSHIFAAIPVAERHRDADNELFKALLAQFARMTSEGKVMKIEKNAGVKVDLRTTNEAIGDRQLNLIIDARPRKTEQRLVLKGYQESAIYDDFSYNFIIEESNFTPDERGDVAKRLAYASRLRESLLANFSQALVGSGWEASIVPGTHNDRVIRSIEEYMQLESDDERGVYMKNLNRGKRPGSIGSRIIREKFTLKLTSGAETRFTEICIYPFERIDGVGALVASGFVDFDNKLKDDMSDRYSAERLYKTPTNDPTAPSVIEMIEPPVWNKEAFEPFIELQSPSDTKEQ